MHGQLQLHYTFGPLRLKPQILKYVPTIPAQAPKLKYGIQISLLFAENSHCSVYMAEV